MSDPTLLYKPTPALLKTNGNRSKTNGNQHLLIPITIDYLPSSDPKDSANPYGLVGMLV